MKIIFLPIFMVCYNVFSMEKPEENSPYLRAIALRTYSNDLVRLTKTRVIPQEREKTILDNLDKSAKELERIAQLANHALAHGHQQVKEHCEKMEKLEDQARQRLFLVVGPLETIETELKQYPIKANL